VISILFASFDYSCILLAPSGDGHSVGFSLISLLISLVFGAVGLLLFYGAFQNYRRFRLLEDTPVMPIRSLPMGFVRIHGKPVADERVISPLTHVPCLYYVVTVDHWVADKSSETGQWPVGLRQVGQVRFHLQDQTGKVLINPDQALMDLNVTFLAETGPRASPNRTVEPSLHLDRMPSESELRDYFSQANTTIHAEMAAEHRKPDRWSANFNQSVSYLPEWHVT
jgi:hypothetical protein